MSEPAAPPRDAEFLGLGFNRLDLEGVLAWITARPPDAPLASIVTPNVDHMVRLDRAGAEMWRLYEEADLCLCDSRIVAGLARAAGIDLPVVPGSDLTAALFRGRLAADERICVVGGTSSTLARLRDLRPDLDIIHHRPPMGLRHDAAARAAAVEAVIAADCRLIFLAVGSPQQEMLAHALKARPEARGIALCIGAAIEFVTGDKARAPVAMQRLGLEWAFRLLSEPRRMWRRYLVEGPRIFLMARRWRRQRRAALDTGRPNLHG